ncbi:hypothetical protein V8B97DRAFT_1917802 [Scleroderma yunnanense]
MAVAQVHLASGIIYPQTHSITSNATCTPDFNWMNNQEQSSPCLVVAYILAVCIGDRDEYDPPNATTITPCYWYFPTSYALFANEMIPYWASINLYSKLKTMLTKVPHLSSSLHVTEAEQIDMQDLTPSVSSTSKLSNLGPIVGSIVGGTTFIILAFGVYYLYRHQGCGHLTNASLEADGGVNPVLQLPFDQSILLQSEAFSPAHVLYSTGNSSQPIPSMTTGAPSMLVSFLKMTCPRWTDASVTGSQWGESEWRTRSSGEQYARS